MRLDWHKHHVALVVVGTIVALVLWRSIVPAWLGFATTVAFGKGLVVLGVVLLIRCGLLSFGQGLFYAVGAYATTLAVNHLHLHASIALLFVGMVLGAAASLIIGLLVSRYREIFFAMLTLAFSMMLYGMLLRSDSVAGGSEGLPLANNDLQLFGSDLTGTKLYYLAGLTVLLVALLARRYAKAPLGFSVQAIRANEIRAGYLGISISRAVLITFIAAGAVAGLGGSIDAMAVGHIDPDLTYWTTSGEFVFVALMSGSSSVYAPLVGSVLFEIIRNYALKGFPDYWQLALGSVLLCVVLFLPGGLWSIGEKLNGYLQRRREPVAPGVPETIDAGEVAKL